MKYATTNPLGLFLSAFLPLVISSQGITAPLSLADRPLYLGASVDPNIFFVIDDSGSMDWEVLKSKGARVVHPSYPNSGDLDFTPNNTAENLELCASYNVLAYNPDVVYVPWSGLDTNDNAYQDQTISAARNNPYNPGSGTRDASGDYYYVWNDADGDGEYDDGECPTDSGSRVYISSLSATQKTNYANWYSYYRKREYVAKAAYSSVVADASGSRMGLMTLNRNNSVNMPIRAMDTAVSVVNSNKYQLMHKLMRINSIYGTPLQNAMFRAGQYLSGGDASWLAGGSSESFPDPRLSLEEGGACQQNFSIVMTDGYYNGSYSFYASTVNDDGDGDTSWDGGNFADDSSDTLADIAMYFYENDLNTNAPPAVPTMAGVDENPDQHVVWYTVAFGVNGELDRSPTDWSESFTWPAPDSEIRKIDDLRHAAYNGRGLFLGADNPQILVQSINEAIGNIIQRTSASAGVTFNSTSIRENSIVFQGRYLTTDWTGQLQYLPLSIDGGVGVAIADAGEELKNISPGDRNIYTWNPVEGHAVSFSWDALSTDQQTTLNEDGSDSLGTYRLAYLRGDKSCEVSSPEICGSGNKIFRRRSGVLGDIINSGAVYVGSPNKVYDFDNYEQYVTEKQSRTPMVYVGANDGILHGFNAAVTESGGAIANVTAQEEFAYIPSMLFPKLTDLTSTLYLHRYYVDGSPIVGDAYFGGGWHTVLLGTLGGGGKGLFALDVTNPDSFDASKVLWEISNSDPDFTDLGYTFGEPAIVRVKTGADSTTWAAVFSNGYNGSSKAVLYVVDLATGNLLKKLDTSASGNGADFNDPDFHGGVTYDNGLSSPAVVDVDGDFIADFVYAGDLYGNMWRFDLTASAPADWAVSFNNTPGFNAASPEGNPQPITTRPSVGAHTERNGYMVYFGTGKYLEESDNSTENQPTQSYYGIWDQWPKGTSTSGFSRFYRSNLLSQWIVEEQTANGVDVRITTDNEINWDNHQGWYIDLTVGGDNQGERQITNSILRDGKVIFTTLISSLAVCDSGGTGWLMELDARNGGRPNQTPFDINQDGIFDDNDLVLSPTAGGSEDNADITVSGAKSQAGILSAPALITSTGGLLDYIGISNSEGTIGLGSILGGGPGSGSGGSSGGGSGSSGSTANGTLVKGNRGIPFGRTMWQWLR
jgi:type IV pilus assembly protein PilY1